MQVYKATPISHGFQGLCALDPREYRIIERTIVATTRLLSTWKALEVEWSSAPDETRQKGLPSMGIIGAVPDFPYLPGAGLVVSERAAHELQGCISKYCELLPLTIIHNEMSYGEYFICHVCNQLDALDLNRSDIRYDNQHSIRDIQRYVFNSVIIADATIFRISTRYPHDVFVTDEFVERIYQQGLDGLRCIPVWSNHEASS